MTRLKTIGANIDPGKFHLHSAGEKNEPKETQESVSQYELFAMRMTGDSRTMSDLHPLLLPQRF